MHPSSETRDAMCQVVAEPAAPVLSLIDELLNIFISMFFLEFRGSICFLF